MFRQPDRILQGGTTQVLMTLGVRRSAWPASSSIATTATSSRLPFLPFLHRFTCSRISCGRWGCLQQGNYPVHKPTAYRSASFSTARRKARASSVSCRNANAYHVDRDGQQRRNRAEQRITPIHTASPIRQRPDSCVRRARLVRIRTEHTAVARFRPEHRLAARTLVEKQTAVCRHVFDCLMPTHRTDDRRGHRLPFLSLPDRLACCRNPGWRWVVFNNVAHYATPVRVA
jgi:hypothetical protein